MFRPSRDIVALGGSAGGPAAVAAVLNDLPETFAAVVLVALHRKPTPGAPYGLPDMLGKRARLPVIPAYDGCRAERGHVYVAAGDHHIVLENGVIRTQESPSENRFRPSLNVLFRSASAAYGRRVVGVLLTGMMGNDGAAGLWEIKHRGGITIVQDPLDAEHPGMPQAAINEAPVDHVLPLSRIASKLLEVVSEPPTGAAAARPRILIVEDESVVATNLQQSLTGMGYEIIDWVPTGEEAVAVAERDHPDVILMDIHLAGALGGVEAARRIWEHDQIPIVYCTAHADLETLKAVQTTESYGYVVKPVQSAAVRAAVELALARREKELR